MDGLDWYNEEELVDQLESDDEEYDAFDLMLMLGVIKEEMTS